MPKTRDQKQQLVKQLDEKLAMSKSVVLANYQGLTMAQLSSLRNQLADQEASFSVIKNNLLRISLKKAGLKADETALEGPTATLMAFGDEITPIKTLAKALKDFQIGSLKLGFLDGEVLLADQIQKLSQLPTKDELRAKIVGSLGTPLYGIVAVLQANIRSLVYLLDGVRKVKGGE